MVVSLLVITPLVCETWGGQSESVPVPGYCPVFVAAMRFNEKELVSLSRQPSEKAAELRMRGPKKGDGNITSSPSSKFGFICGASAVSHLSCLYNIV